MKSLRELILIRIEELINYPYNGRYAQVDFESLPELDDYELLRALEKVIKAAYSQR